MASPKQQSPKEETHASFVAKAGANVCLRSAPRRVVLAGDVNEQRVTLFHVEDAVLARASPVFRDMLVLGKPADGQKSAVPMEEDFKTIEHLLYFMQDDIIKHPDTIGMPAEELAKLYSASIKYQACLIQSIVEHSIRLRLKDRNDKIYTTANLSSVVKLACASERKALMISISEGVARLSTNLSGSFWQDLSCAVGGPGNALLMSHVGQQLQTKTNTVQVDVNEVKRRVLSQTPPPNTHAAAAYQRETVTILDRVLANLAKLLQ